MKIRIAILITLVVSLLLGGAVLQAIVPTAVQSDGPDPAPQYAVEQGTISGSGYHLTTQSPGHELGDTWHASGTASGTGYRLQGPAAPSLRGSGCCCTYLPCALRNR